MNTINSSKDVVQDGVVEGGQCRGTRPGRGHMAIDRQRRTACNITDTIYASESPSIAATRITVSIAVNRRPRHREFRSQRLDHEVRKTQSKTKNR